MAREKGKTKEEREQTTVAQFLNDDRLTLPVRDYLTRYVEGSPLPYSDSVSPYDYAETELIVGVLADEADSLPDLRLPEAAIDYVREYLYRLEERLGIHIWNVPDVARAAFPIMVSLTEGTDAGRDFTDSAVKAALRRLSTPREWAEFCKRRRVGDDYEGRDAMAGSAELAPDYYGPRKLSRYLADPRTPEKVRRDLGAALVKLASLTNTHVDHPALAMRAAEVIFAAIEDKEADTQEARTFRQLIATLDELPEMPGREGGDE
jgi:hypothetical protein